MIELESIIETSYLEWLKGKDGKKRKHPSMEVYRELFKQMFPYAAAAYAATLQAQEGQVNVPVEQNEGQVVTAVLSRMLVIY